MNSYARHITNSQPKNTGDSISVASPVLFVRQTDRSDDLAKANGLQLGNVSSEPKTFAVDRLDNQRAGLPVASKRPRIRRSADWATRLKRVPSHRSQRCVLPERVLPGNGQVIDLASEGLRRTWIVPISGNSEIAGQQPDGYELKQRLSVSEQGRNQSLRCGDTNIVSYESTISLFVKVSGFLTSCGCVIALLFCLFF